MGKIKLNNDQEVTIITDGVLPAGDYLTLMLAADNMTLEQADQLFSNPENTEKIWVVDYLGELFQSYTGFTQLQEVAKEYDAIVDYTEDEDQQKIPVTGTAIRVKLYRPNDVEKRMDGMEERMDTMQTNMDMAVAEMTMLIATSMAAEGGEENV